VVAHVLGEDPLAQPTWFDRSGTSLGTVGPARNYAEVRLSPDGGTAVVDIPDRESGTRELWLLDTTTAALSRLTSHPATDWIAAWSRDGSQIAFASDRAGASSVFRKRADGTGDDVLVYRGSFGAFPTDWSPDGRTLLAHQDRPPGGTILAISVADGSATPLLESKQAAVLRATYTPDGRWIAYESRETGTEEIYVSPVGRPGRMRVSVAGGTEPRWRADGRELFFVSASGELMAAPVIASDPLRLAPPIKLFTLCASRSQPGFFAGVPQAVNATADGKRFLIRCADSPEASTSGFGVLLNWSSKLP
jgi:Tol biopolymer transport system component